MKKILSVSLILAFTFTNLLSPALAISSNYVPVSTTTTESYSASSPVGRFETHNGNYNPPVYNVYTTPYAAPYAGYDAYGNIVVQSAPIYSQQTPVVPVNNTYTNQDNTTNAVYNMNPTNTANTSQENLDKMAYNVPAYAGGVTYGAQNAYNSSIQDIEVPQNYTKTTSSDVNYIDPREKADKVIDRGLKVLGGLAVGAAAAGLLIMGLKD